MGRAGDVEHPFEQSGWIAMRAMRPRSARRRKGAMLPILLVWGLRGFISRFSL